MNPVTARNPRYASADGAAIDMLVVFEAQSGELQDEWPFTARAGEPGYVGDLHARAVQGDFGAVAPFVPPQPVVPAEISDRQFFQQLALSTIITQQEALDAVRTGAIPAPLLPFLDALPANDRFAAEMLLSGATTFYRNHPLTVAVGAAQGMTPTQIDQFFIAAAQL